MTFETMAQQLRKTGAYQTSAKPQRTVIDRLMGWSSFWYHARITGVVAAANRVARRDAYDRQAWRFSSYSMIRVLENCGGRIEASGFNKLYELDGPAVCVANHMSSAETVMLPMLILENRQASFVVKTSLLTYPLFGVVMRAVNPIAVTRENPRQDLKTVLEEGQRKLQEGRNVILFPQATRSHELDTGAFNTLGAKLAARTGVPMLPIAIKTDFQHNGRWVKDWGKIDRSRPAQFEMGPVLEPTGNGRAAHEEALGFITGRLREWGAAVR